MGATVMFAYERENGESDFHSRSIKSTKISPYHKDMIIQVKILDQESWYRNFEKRTYTWKCGKVSDVYSKRGNLCLTVWYTRFPGHYAPVNIEHPEDFGRIRMRHPAWFSISGSTPVFTSDEYETALKMIRHEKRQRLMPTVDFTNMSHVTEILPEDIVDREIERLNFSPDTRVEILRGSHHGRSGTLL